MGFKGSLQVKPRLENVGLVFLGGLSIFFFILARILPDTDVEYDYMDGNYSDLPTIPSINMDDYTTLNWPLSFYNPDSENFEYSRDSSSIEKPLDEQNTDSSSDVMAIDDSIEDSPDNKGNSEDNSSNSLKFPDEGGPWYVIPVDDYNSDSSNSDYSKEGGSNVDNTPSTNSYYSEDSSSNWKHDVDKYDAQSTNSYYLYGSSSDAMPITYDIPNSYYSENSMPVDNIDSTNLDLDSSSSTSIPIQVAYYEFTEIKDYQYNHFRIFSFGCLDRSISCSLKMLVPETQWEGPNLVELIVNSSMLHVIDDGAFMACENLIVLRLMFSRIGWIGGGALSGLGKLVDLNLTHNEISLLETGAFDSLKSLKILDLSHNQLSTINQYVFEESEIQYLNLSFNSLTSFNASVYKGIEHVDLSHNKITSSDFNLRRKLFNSQLLNALNTQQSKLVILDLSHNFITDVQLGSSLDSLRAINLANNRIKFFALDNPNVRELMLRNNLVEYFDSLQLAKLRNCSLMNNRIPCAQLQEALYSLDCVLDSPEGVRGITCVKEEFGVEDVMGDMLSDSNLLILFNFMLGLALVCVFVYYTTIIGYTWVNIKKINRR